MNVTRNMLSFPRNFLLLLLGLLGPFLLATTLIDWFGDADRDSLVVRTVVFSIFTALFLAVKFTKFLVPSEKLETFVRTKAAAWIKEKRPWIPPRALLRDYRGLSP